MRLLVAALASLVVVSGAAGATFTYSVATPSPVTVAGVTLNGLDQPKTFAIASSVAYTGGGNTAGWKVQASATTPTSGSKALPALLVTAGTFSCVSGCTTNPTNGVTYPITLSTAAQTIYNAAANTGRGTFTVTSTLSLNYVASALPGTYSSTVTLSGSTGP
ncbi:MAG: hypothetical protein ACJ77E_21695 [Gaiellaceae bacterium]